MIGISASALIVLSVLIVGLSAWGVAFPTRLVSFVRNFMQKGGIAFAIGVRIVLAMLLWVTAPMSHTPTVFYVLAVLALAAAFGISLMGRERVLRLMDRVTSWPDMVLRLQCVFGVAFGVFLAWSVSSVWAGT